MCWLNVEWNERNKQRNLLSFRCNGKSSRSSVITNVICRGCKCRNDVLYVTCPRLAGKVLASPCILNFVPHKFDVTSTNFTSSGSVSTYANSSFVSDASFKFVIGFRSLHWFDDFDWFELHIFRCGLGEFLFSRFSLSLSDESPPPVLWWSQFKFTLPDSGVECFAVSNPVSEYWWNTLLATSELNGWMSEIDTVCHEKNGWKSFFFQLTWYLWIEYNEFGTNFWCLFSF